MKKCIVLDLDNTLWGGIIGEDGLSGIQLSLASPGGSFMAFQQALLDLQQRGVLLAINSKNNYEDAMEVIRTHPNMILKEPHFAAVRINWNEKTQNIRELAQELNIGLDSMVFLDDTAANREAMRAFVPEVETPELPADPSEYTKFLLSLDYFETRVITDEDKMRGNLYVTERLRKEAEKSFADPTEFLKSLGLEISVYRDRTSSIERLAQLTEKTNQFNTKKQPLSVAELEVLMQSPQATVFYGNVTDRFGDHGITAFALVHTGSPEWRIESFILSCRIIGRGVEEAFLHAIAAAALREGAQMLKIEFVETEKNAPARAFIEKQFIDSTVPANNTSIPAWITLHSYDI